MIPVEAWLRDPGISWSVGVAGAIAEFARDSGEALEVDAPAEGRLATARGGIAIGTLAGTRRVETEKEVALCLPERPDNAPTVFREIGRDALAIRPDDRAMALFDLGLGVGHVAACVRARNGAEADSLRVFAGRPLFAADHAPLKAIAALSPARVFVSPLARIEVYQRIPAPTDKTPAGPHTHVLRGLLRRGDDGKAPAAPEGWRRCLSVYGTRRAG